MLNRPWRNRERQAWARAKGHTKLLGYHLSSRPSTPV
jgi:hypothetical protein